MGGLILSIESSCDDSSIALTEIQTKKIIFHQKISQEKQHSVFGGVVPELASRLHAELLPQILEKTQSYFKDLKAIAVTTQPGLNITLLEGLMMAKTLAYTLNIPLIGVNHLKGHLYSLFLEKDSIFPLGVLLVSGGHSMLFEARSFTEMKIVARSIDDSFGESFDKVSKMLGLGYPGGPIVESYAKSGNDLAFSFPIPLKSKKKFAFSFSGLKNAVRLEIEKAKSKTIDLERFKADICASFQRVAVEHLCQKCNIFLQQNQKREDKEYQWRHFAIVGGASANGLLREKITRICENYGIFLLLSPLEYCSDNAVMIGRVAIESYMRKEFDDLNLQAIPKMQTF